MQTALPAVVCTDEEERAHTSRARQEIVVSAQHEELVLTKLKANADLMFSLK